MTNAEARFNNSLHPRKPEGSLGRTAQDGHLDSHTAPELGVSCMSKAVLHFSGFLCSHKVCRLPGVCNTETNKQIKNTIRAKHEKSQEQADSLFLADITFGKKRIKGKFS